jgi:hypothetical protein
MQDLEFLNKVYQKSRLSEDESTIETIIEDGDDDELFTANSAEEMIADALGDPNWKNSL